ncbi:MAG TPA: sugar phosphate isomerase/epimerase [Candidatus Limnocylindria bacterium]|nr:sugar phosphate isomerase/epimerase [Candidatus Limnocylindria bacterium]
MNTLLRRLTGLVSVLALFTAVQAADLSDQLAIQTWTLRKLSFDQVIAFAQKHGIKELQLIPNHIDYKKETNTEIVAKKAKLEAAGLHAYTYGVAGTSLDKEENRKLFEFAKFMGMKLIIVEPGDFKIWDNLEELAIQYDIKVATHNHGIKSTYGNPATVRNILQHRDAHLGVCLDIGWVTSANFDAAKVFREYNGRVFDLHLKDKRIEKVKEGDDVSMDTEIGEGQANLKGLFKALKETGYTGKLAIETDSEEFARAPDEFIEKAKAFVSENGK